MLLFSAVHLTQPVCLRTESGLIASMIWLFLLVSLRKATAAVSR